MGDLALLVYFSLAVCYLTLTLDLKRIFNTYINELMLEDKDIGRSLIKLNDKIDAIDHLLRGDGKLDTPSGLVYNVAENTKFRRFLTRVFWSIFLANTGLTAIIIFLLEKLYRD